MKLEEIWNKNNEDNTSIKKEDILLSMSYKPTDVLNKLVKQMFIKLLFTVTFTIFYSILLFFIEDRVTQVLFTVLLVSHIIAIVYFYREWKKAKVFMPMDGAILDTLKTYSKRVKQMLKYEEKVGVFLYPIAASAGFFLALMQKKTWDEVMAEPIIWVVLVASIVVLTPLGYLSARWLNKIAFGKYLKQLDARIEELETTEIQ